MAIVATRYRNRDDFPEGIDIDTRGIRAFAHYHVNTDLLVKAMNADGLPKIGAPFDPAYPTLTAVRVGNWERLGGQDRTGDGDGGHSRVRVEYATPTFGTIATNYQTWTEVRTQMESVNVLYPFSRLVNEPTPDVLAMPIGNGDGVDVPVGRLWLGVHVYRRKTDPGPLFPIQDVMSLLTPTAKLNNAGVTTPNVHQSGRAYAFAASQLLYQGIESIQDAGDYVEIVHGMLASTNWIYRWQSEDSRGKRARQFQDTIFETGNFAGLW